MGGQVIIDEEELTTFARYCVDRGNLMDEMIDRLSGYMAQVSSAGIVSGKTALAVREYATEIDSMKQQMGFYSGEVSRAISSFLTEVEMAEQYRG